MRASASSSAVMRSRRRSGLASALFAALALLLVGASTVRAQSQSMPVSTDTVLEARTRAVAAQLRCPVCQGNSIEDSPSELAQDMKGVVREQLASGKSPDEVKQYFIAKYGEWILLEPKATGFNLVVYALPMVLVLIGGVVVWRAVKKWTAEPAEVEDGI